MTLPLVYLDHNIISLQSSGRIDLSKLALAHWVYSTEHFAEIRRSQNSAPFLQALDQLEAMQLELVILEGKLTGECLLLDPGSSAARYQRYLDVNDAVGFDVDLFSPFLSWMCGGGSADRLRELPDQLAAAMSNLLVDVPVELRPPEAADLGMATSEFVETLVDMGNDIVIMREHMGFGKGAAGNIESDNPLQAIWETIKNGAPSDLAAHQFFGFEPFLANQERPVTWLGIIGCCSVLDIVGYKSEKKVRRTECVPNVLSDSVHIANGAYCQTIVSSDKLLVARAKAIYEFLGIGTQVLYLDISTDEQTRTA